MNGMKTRRAFTLVELLTVIAIMGILGMAAVSGYQAITRGMAERGALRVAKNLAETARQRANLDRCRTYVYLYNEVESLETEDDPGKVTGLAIAVKGVGRMSAVDGNDWYDEFGDMDQLFRAMEEDGEPLDEADYEKKSSKFRIFNLRQQKMAVVRNGLRFEITEDDLEDGQTHQIVVFGFRKLEGDASFIVGEEYGKEFSAVRLPNGFTFSSSVSMSSANDLGLKPVAVHVIEAGANSAPILQVFARRADGSFQSIGSTSQVKD